MCAWRGTLKLPAHLRCVTLFYLSVNILFEIGGARGLSAKTLTEINTTEIFLIYQDPLRLTGGKYWNINSLDLERLATV